MTITLSTAWDNTNSVFSALKKAYFCNDAFWVAGAPFEVKEFKRVEPKPPCCKDDTEIAVTCVLEKWPECMWASNKP